MEGSRLLFSADLRPCWLASEISQHTTDFTGQLKAFQDNAVLMSPFLKLFPPYLRLVSRNLTDLCSAVTGGGSVCECGRLSPPSWLSGPLWYNIVTLTYLLIWAMLIDVYRVHNDGGISLCRCWDRNRLHAKLSDCCMYRKAGLLTILCKSIANTNTNTNTDLKKYCQYQYFYNEYFCTAIQLAKCDSYMHVSQNNNSQNH